MDLKTPTLSDKNDFLKTAVTFREVVRPERVVALTNLKNFVQGMECSKFWNDTCNTLSEVYGKAINEMSLIGDIINKMKYDEINKEWYITTTYFSKSEYGRVYAEYGSIGTMRRIFRHFVSEDIYYDIDMKSCHPTILWNICEAWHIPCKYLKEWIDDRPKIIKKLMKSGFTKDQGKKLISALINGSTIDNFLINEKLKPKKLTKFVKNFYEEIQTIHKLVKNHDQTTKDIYEATTKNKKFNKIGTFISIYLQMAEMKILEFAVDFTVDYGITDRLLFEGVCIHDGFQIKSKLFDNNIEKLNQYLKILNNSIYEEFGFKVEFINKPFDEADVVKKELENINYKMPEDYVCPFFEKYGVHKKDNYKERDDDIAELFYYGNSDNYVSCDNKFYFLDNNGLYKEMSNPAFTQKFTNYMKDFIQYIDNNHTKNEFSRFFKYNVKTRDYYEKVLKLDEDICNKIISKGDHSKIMKFFEKCESFKSQSNNKLVNKITNETSRSSIVKTLKNKYTDDNFHSLLDSDDNLLGFENGLLDLNTMEFRKAKKGEYVHMSTGYDWFYNNEIPDIVIERSKEIYKIINGMFINEADTIEILKILSRCLRGTGNIEEIALFLKGKGGNGKSLLMLMMKVLFGDYYSPLSHTVFVKEASDNRSPDVAELIRKRFIECSEPTEEMVFLADIFKRYTGNDEMTTRGNYHKGKLLKFKCSPLHFCSNHYINFNKGANSDSMKRRVWGAYLPYKFCDPEEYDEKNKWHKLKDKSLKDKFENDVTYKQGLMFLFIKYYQVYKRDGLKKTDNMVKATNDYFKNMSENADLINTILEKTDNSSDKIILSNKNGYGLRELYLLENNSDKFSTTKFNKFIKKEFGDSALGVGMLGYDARGFWNILNDKTAEKMKGRVLIGYKYKDSFLKKHFDDDDSDDEPSPLDM